MIGSRQQPRLRELGAGLIDKRPQSRQLICKHGRYKRGLTSITTVAIAIASHRLESESAQKIEKRGPEVESQKFLMTNNSAWTIFGLPLHLDRITGQRAFVIILFFTFFNNPEQRVPVVILAVFTYLAIRNSR